jgi:hypothetical protein
MPNRARVPLAVVVFALVAAACGSAPATAPLGSAGPSATTTSRIDHPTGATDVVLQMELGGDFVPIDFGAGTDPIFTLYGDGRVVFQQFLDVFPQPDARGITRNVPWRTAQLDAGQIEDLLKFALGPGGLETAREAYENDSVLDSLDAIFTVNAGGAKKTVTVYVLEMEPIGGPDDAARAQLQRLAARLRDFDAHGTLASDPYVPRAYRGVMFAVSPEDRQPIAWPWPAIAPADFKPGADDGSGAQLLPQRTLSPEEVAALGLGDLSSGLGLPGVLLKGPDGTTYLLAIRPLLPNETE